MFEPRIVCFFCKWCTYAGADLAGTSRKQYPPNGVVVRVNCSGRIDPQHIIWALREGADGVLIGGCHPGDCHYQDGNHKTMRRVAFLKRMLDDMGIDPRRLHLEWISAAEGEKLVHVMGDFVSTVKEMGPLDIELAGGGKGGFAAAPPKPAKKPDSKAKSAGKAPARKKTARKPAAKKVASKKKPAKKKTARKPAAKKVASKKKPAGKKTARKPAAKKVASKKKPARKKTARTRAAKKTVARKRQTKKAPAKKTTPAKKKLAKKAPGKTKRASGKRPVRKTTARRPARKASAGRKKR